MNADPSQSAAPALVIGVGNTIRGDDAVGLLLLRDLAGGLPAGTDHLECESAGFEILDHMAGRETVIIIDALRTDDEQEVGEVVCRPLGEAPASVTLMPSHGFDIATLLQAYRQAMPDRFPRTVHLILVKVIEVDDFREGLSPQLTQRYPQVRDRVATHLHHLLASRAASS